MPTYPPESPLLTRIHQAWVNADHAFMAARLTELNMDGGRFRAIIAGFQRPTGSDLAMLADAFRVTVGWLTDAHEPVLWHAPDDEYRVGVPAEVCDTCSNFEAGQLVPASFCEKAKAKMGTDL